MSCCQYESIDDIFDRKLALKELKKYRKKGPWKTTALLLKAIHSIGIEGLTFLDIGGGIGSIQQYLLKNGAIKGTSIDASKAYLEVAEEACEESSKAKIEYIHADFTAVGAEIPPSDIVTLDRVICCYDDMPVLVDLSSGLARKVYAVVYPKDNWLIKTGFYFINLVQKIKGSSFRIFVYSRSDVEAIINKNGFKPAFQSTSFIWRVAVFIK